MDLNGIKTPAYVIDEGRLKNNLEILKEVSERAGCKILLAQKAFSAFCEYPLIGKYLAGATSSGLFEARLGKEEMGKENHVFSPAYRKEDIEELAAICDHVIFNSFYQLECFAKLTAKIQKEHGFENGVGLRINPECSTQEEPIYDPCAPGSRLGVTKKNFTEGLKEYPDAFKYVSGFHMHTLCEQGAEPLEKTLRVFEKKFGDVLSLPQIRWLNLGGGHHITKPGYDRELLIKLVKNLKDKYSVEVYLEPGEAVALNAGYLVTEVMDIVDNGIKILILDASAACHMPDVLEMPYRPPLKDCGLPDEKPYTYRLSSCTCLAGDITGDYSFDNEIKRGDRLVFEDMAIYSMVKNNTFNGMPLPSIYAMDEAGSIKNVKAFDYDDFKNRLS